jgi:hypothetical protein
MSLESEQDSPASRYPKTNAEWVTSPLMREQSLQRNPLEAAPPAVKPSGRLGALLIILGGVLGLIGVFVPWATYDLGNGASPVSEFDFFTHFSLWYVLLAVLSIFCSTGAVVRGISLARKSTVRWSTDALALGVGGLGAQVGNAVSLVFAVVASPGAVAYTLEAGYGLIVASFLLVLAGACVIKFITRPKMSLQEIADEVRARRTQQLIRARRRRIR